MLNKKIVQKNFSKYAHFYDLYSDIQEFTAKKLLEYFDAFCPKNILEVGCGTGIYTFYLMKKFPSAKIDAIDFSYRMLLIAKKKIKHANVKFHLLDAEEFKSTKQYELITSNMCFQWFSNLTKTFCSYKNLLKKGGYILFSTLGPKTLYQLDYAIETLFGNTKRIQAAFFKDLKDIKGAMKIFRQVKIEEFVYKKEYNSLVQLLKQIRYTGEKGKSIFKHILTPRLILKLEDIYKEKFGKIIADFQIFFCKGIK